MVKIRLSRKGSKKRPFYTIIVTDSRNSRNGLFIEKVGYFNPILNKKKNSLSLNSNRIEFWKNRGAILSNRVKSIIKKNMF